MKAARRVFILDEVRGFAALYVAAAHVLLHNLELRSGWARLPWLLGQEMVMAFFLISGAAIRLSVMDREGRVDGAFMRRRFLRLFPMVVLGLAVGYGAATLEAGAWRPLRGSELLGNLLFLQDFASVKPGTICDTYYGNAMLWSLSYEWWFYVIFFVLWRTVPVARRTSIAGAISLVGAATLGIYPTAPGYWAAYFIVWWAGGTMVDPDVRERRRALGWLCGTVAVITAIVAKAYYFEHEPIRPGVFPLLVLRHLGGIAVVSGSLVVAGSALKNLGEKWLRGFAWAAPISYALYVMHYPLASDARWLERAGLQHGVASAAVYGGLAVIVAWLAEKYFQPWACRWLGRLPGLRTIQ